MAILNWLDITVLVLVVSSAMCGLARGLLRELAGLLGLLFGLYLAMRYHQVLALAVDSHWGGTPWARTVVFVLLTLATWIAGELTGFLAGKTVDFTGARWLDRVIGGMFGVLRGFIIAGAILLLVDHYFSGANVPVKSSTLGRPAIATARAIGGRIWHEIRPTGAVNHEAHVSTASGAGAAGAGKAAAGKES